MKTYKELSQSKYLQPWYKNKIKAMLWKKCIFQPTIYYMLFKETVDAVINNGGNILAYPEYRWAYNMFEREGNVEGIRKILNIKYNLEYIVDSFNKL